MSLARRRCEVHNLWPRGCNVRFFFSALLVIGMAQGLGAQPPQDIPHCPFKAPRDDCATVPKATFTPQPNFSDYARKKRLEGNVILSLTVLSDGTVDDVKVTRSLEKSLDEQAIKTVRTWKFEPSMYQGKPISYSTAVEVNFRLY